jgi:hypothetical protein
MALFDGAPQRVLGGAAASSGELLGGDHIASA